MNHNNNFTRTIRFEYNGMERDVEVGDEFFERTDYFRGWDISQGGYRTYRFDRIVGGINAVFMLD